MEDSQLASAESSLDLLNKIRHLLVDRIWQGLFVIALLGTPASVWRSYSTGWLPLYSFHLALALAVIVVYLFRGRIPFATRSALLLVVFFSIGIVGLFTLGLLGAGLWPLVMCSLLVSTLYSMRAGIASAAAAALLIAAAGYLFTQGLIKLPVDANTYTVTASSWVALLLATSVIPFVVFHSIAAFQYATFDLLKEVNRQRVQIELLATHDQLTGLPLQNLLRDRLQMAINTARRNGTKIALLFIDLDGFKAVNDTLGHEAGDLTLREVAARLLTAIRDGDTAARVGGDEFIVILANLENAQEAAQIAERTISAISQPIAFADNSIFVGASIGIGVFPDHAQDEVTLRRMADEAMYAVKKTGKNHFMFAEAK